MPSMSDTIRPLCRHAVRLVLLAGALAGPGIAPALGMALTDEPVEVIPVAPPPARATAEAPARSLLADRIGALAATGPVRTPNGRASQLAESLGVRFGSERTYGAVRVSVFRLGDEPLAYALLRFLRPEEASPSSIGDDAWTASSQVCVRIGDFTILVDGGTGPQRDSIAAALVSSVGRPEPNARLVSELPSGDRIPDSTRYISSFELLRRFRPDLVEDVYRFGAGGADGVVADFATGSAAPVRVLLVEYQTPQLAAEAYTSVMRWHDALAEPERASRIVKREGNYLIEATGVSGADAARVLVDGIRYDYRIKMLNGPSPEEGGLDVAREAYLTAMVVVGSLRLVGAGLLLALGVGFGVGAVIFIRRRRAAADVFSDAGGMVHLELEGAPRRLTPGESRGLLPDRSQS